MISTYLVDRINIITKAFDQNGASTETTQSAVKARVEDTNQMILDQTGREVKASAYLIVDKDANIKYTSLVEIVSHSGQSFEMPLKRWAIKKLSKAHGFTISHWEVWI